MELMEQLVGGVYTEQNAESAEKKILKIVQIITKTLLT